MRSILEERGFPVGELRLLASERSRGRQLAFRGEQLPCELLTADSFAGVDLAFFAAGGAGEHAVRAGRRGGRRRSSSTRAACSARTRRCRWWCRRSTRTPWTAHQGLIATPNCSTIQMVVALKPIYDAAGIERVVVSTYQAVSGSGQRGVDELRRQAPAVLAGDPAGADFYPHQIAFNLLPHIDGFLPSGYTKEEQKMVDETVKIFADPQLKVTATCVRVPVFTAHSEAVNVQTRTKLSAAEARELLAAAPGVEVDRRPGAAALPHAGGGGRQGRRLRGPHPRRRDHRERPRLLVRLGQPAQGRRTQRRADRRGARAPRRAEAPRMPDDAPGSRGGTADDLVSTPSSSAPARPASRPPCTWPGRAARCVVLERNMAGGQMALTDLIENYPGFPDGIGGFELSDRLKAAGREVRRRGARDHRASPPWRRRTACTRWSPTRAPSAPGPCCWRPAATRARSACPARPSSSAAASPPAAPATGRCIAAAPSPSSAAATRPSKRACSSPSSPMRSTCCTGARSCAARPSPRSGPSATPR